MGSVASRVLRSSISEVQCSSGKVAGKSREGGRKWSVCHR
jgi:hypothetical protein